MINVKETTPGNFDITCEVSGRPLNRVNEYGMYCDAEVCQCDIENKRVGNDLMGLIDSFIEGCPK